MRNYQKDFQLKIPKLRKNYIAADWQFLAVFDSFLGSKGFKNNIEPIFFMQWFTKTNFSSKFQFWEKMMAAPPRAKLVQRICWCGHVQYVYKLLKIGFVFFGNNFRVMDLFLGTVYNVHSSQKSNESQLPHYEMLQSWSH